MKNFWKEHKGYIDLKMRLFEIDPRLAEELQDVVADAMDYGIKRLYEKIRLKDK